MPPPLLTCPICVNVIATLIISHSMPAHSPMPVDAALPSLDISSVKPRSTCSTAAATKAQQEDNEEEPVESVKKTHCNSHVLDVGSPDQRRACILSKRILWPRKWGSPVTQAMGRLTHSGDGQVSAQSLQRPPVVIAHKFSSERKRKKGT
ncbi:hypothetical protein BDN71DRAFT_1432683 [Pleurotus eryngii]|uniref:Uncharacterized protein n=1 Tax=Pleurotus eryngii TaxID=5323 RepID=A0A9P5ZV21_PLEER|nr:hypothetical protein BDN71DRAFT_1432683 [Pleurotus eryngii]